MEKEEQSATKQREILPTRRNCDEVVIKREVNEEGAAETTSEMPTSEVDTTTEDDDTYVCDEETIERNFKTFRSYIETCVKVTDLIVFYDLFTAGKIFTVSLDIPRKITGL